MGTSVVLEATREPGLCHVASATATRSRLVRPACRWPAPHAVSSSIIALDGIEGFRHCASAVEGGFIVRMIADDSLDPIVSRSLSRSTGTVIRPV
jgi:hypothetical protein